MSLLVVVPYRNREEHLKEFIEAMAQFEILIVEQAQGKPFNRAKLFNVAFHYTHGKYLNYCFHDVDMLPIQADYSLCHTPTHLAVEVEQFGWKLPYERYFGGVTIFDRASFMKVNGCANEYWGWGQEDDDLRRRCETHGIFPDRRTGRFKSLPHPSALVPELLQENQRKFYDGENTGGLSDLKYILVSEAKNHIVVDV